MFLNKKKSFNDLKRFENEFFWQSFEQTLIEYNKIF